MSTTVKVKLTKSNEKSLSGLLIVQSEEDFGSLLDFLSEYLTQSFAGHGKDTLKETKHDFFRANYRKANHKINSLTQCDLTVNGCDWHINKGDDERIVL